MRPLESYIEELRAIRASGAAVKETAYYAPLSNLLTEIGKKLKPKVRCIMQLQDTGAGLPDGGLFTEEQTRSTLGDLTAGAIPARGAIEAKPTSADAWKIAESNQVKDYWGRYRQVLVTNYRDFLLVGADEDGNRTVLETYRLAKDEREFWRRAAHPKQFADLQSESLEEFLKRVVLYQAQLDTPRDLAGFLASYAREAKFRIQAGELPALAGIRTALEEALGLKFEGVRGDHFFRSALIQTLFYGTFSAWVLWSKARTPTDKSRFEWRMSAQYLRLPILRKLFYEVAEPGQLEMMNLPEVLDWAGGALNRVDRASFFAMFEEDHAVQYFYEPFLEAFDPELRKDLGVWYTPLEVVKYMVARVDAELRNTLGLSDGLADPNVYVLDPCCGTGAYLAEVLRLIAATLRAKGGDALVGHDLRCAAIDRVYGFEILPAPFVISHLQLGLLLQQNGIVLGHNQRVSVFLTNSLTNWDPPKGPIQHLLFKEMEDERDAANRVKRDAPILVVLGNPPYNAFAGVSPAEEHGVVNVYKEGLVRQWGIRKFNLDDLYIRFFRLAERRIAEMTGKGIVCYISNFSYLSEPSFVVMRKRFVEEFDDMWFDSLNGDSRETGKLTPEGRPDPSVFSTTYNPEGIKKGTAIGLLVRNETRVASPRVRFRQFWGATKRQDLLHSVDNGGPKYEQVSPSSINRYSLRPSSVESAYRGWPSLTEIAGQLPLQGMDEDRANALVGYREEDIKPRMEGYFDPEWHGANSVC